MISVLAVTYAVTVAISRDPIKILSQAKESDSSPTLLAFNPRETSKKEAKQLAGPLQEPLQKLTKSPTSDLPQNSTRKPTKVTSIEGSLVSSGALVLSKKRRDDGKAVRAGRRENYLTKSINGLPSFLTKNSSPDHIGTWLKSSSNENIKEPTNPLQQVNLQNSLNNMDDENRNKISRRKQTPTSISAHKSSKFHEKEMNLSSVPSIFTKLKQNKVEPHTQDYSKKPGKHILSADINLKEEKSYHNIQARKSIKALLGEPAAVLELESMTSLALKRLRPPTYFHKAVQDIITSSKPRLTLGLIEASDAEPLKTILNLWDSDEEGDPDSNLSEYDEESSTEEDDGDS